MPSVTLFIVMLSVILPNVGILSFAWTIDERMPKEHSQKCQSEAFQNEIIFTID
jgi:hypothetical protein